MDQLMYQIIVRGKVQGVWFRKYTCDYAKSIGLTGIVKNDFDGSVYIEAVGKVELLDLMVTWLYHGSPLSRVTSVDYKLVSPKYYNSFEILG